MPTTMENQPKNGKKLKDLHEVMMVAIKPKSSALGVEMFGIPVT
jgi:hypothetical protein